MSAGCCVKLQISETANRPGHVTPARYKHLNFLEFHHNKIAKNYFLLFLQQIFKKLNEGAKPRLRDIDWRGKGRCHEIFALSK